MVSAIGIWIQTQEERDHAMLMLKYLRNNGRKIVLEPDPGSRQGIEEFDRPAEGVAWSMRDM